MSLINLLRFGPYSRGNLEGQESSHASSVLRLHYSDRTLDYCTYPPNQKKTSQTEAYLPTQKGTTLVYREDGEEKTYLSLPSPT